MISTSSTMRPEALSTGSVSRQSMRCGVPTRSKDYANDRFWEEEYCALPEKYYHLATEEELEAAARERRRNKGTKVRMEREHAPLHLWLMVRCAAEDGQGDKGLRGMECPLTPAAVADGSLCGTCHARQGRHCPRRALPRTMNATSCSQHLTFKQDLRSTSTAILSIRPPTN